MLSWIQFYVLHLINDISINNYFEWRSKIRFTNWLGIVFCDAGNSDGLCFQLIKACPKEPEAIPFKDLEVERSEIVKSRKLGAGQFGEVWAGKRNKMIVYLKQFNSIDIVMTLVSILINLNKTTFVWKSTLRWTSSLAFKTVKSSSVCHPL